MRNLFSKISIRSIVLKFVSTACDLLESGVAGLFGPRDKSASYFVQSMCDAMDLPYITTRWDPEQTRGNAINLYPHPEILSTVVDIIIKSLFD